MARPKMARSSSEDMPIVSAGPSSETDSLGAPLIGLVIADVGVARGGAVGTRVARGEVGVAATSVLAVMALTVAVGNLVAVAASTVPKDVGVALT